MITAERTAKNVRIGFIYGVLCTVVDVVVLRKSFRDALNCGVASFAGATAYLTTVDFLRSEDEYIDERTEESN